MRNVHIVYFSPTFSSKKVAQMIGCGLGGRVEEIDITKPEIPELTFSQDDLVIFAVPVYSGRVPGLVATHFQKIKGNGALAVSVVVYGNRDYDDSLLELKSLCKNAGFEVVACGAFIAQHTYSAKIAAGRPNAQDEEVAKNFGKQILAKITDGKAPWPEIAVKGNYPYVKLGAGHIVPFCSEACTLCGHCAETCPTGAIPLTAPNTTTEETCIACGRCIKICPQNARSFPNKVVETVEQHLLGLCKEEKQPELYL